MYACIRETRAQFFKGCAGKRISPFSRPTAPPRHLRIGLCQNCVRWFLPQRILIHCFIILCPAIGTGAGKKTLALPDRSELMEDHGGVLFGPVAFEHGWDGNPWHGGCCDPPGMIA